jgi:ribosomal protein S18 acetylase RimI-like enzyme
VRPDRIRLGVGSALLSAALQNAKTTHRCGSASLLVSVNGGPAIALYERAGFTKGARKPSYFANGEDALEMTKGL